MAQYPPYREVAFRDGELIFKRNFHKGQSQAWESEKRWVFLLAGTQSGKTVFGCDWLDREIDRCGEGDYLIVTANFPLLEKKLEKEFLTLFRDVYNEHDLPPLGKYNSNKRIFQYYNDSTRIFLCSADNPASLESATAKAAWIDECGQPSFSHEAFDAVVRRVSRAVGEGGGRILGTTTLYNFSGWLKSEIYIPWLNGDPNIDVIQFDSIDCPGFPREVYEEARAKMPSWKFDLFYRGRFSKPAGLIYDAFNEKACVVRRFKIPESWPCYVGHDFGANATAALWFAMNPATNDIYAYREYLAGGMSAAEHAQCFKELSTNENIIKRVGGSVSEDGWRESFTAAGWPILKPLIKDIEPGIDKVYAFHKLDKMYFFDDLIQTLEEMQTYSRELDDRYEATEKIRDKQRFHRMDAMRYIVSEFNLNASETGKVTVWRF
jgi:hypothetical protein